MSGQFIQVGNTLNGLLLVRDTSETPVNADALPTFDVYMDGVRILNGTTTKLHSGSVTGATNASPIVLTSTAHGLATGQIVTVANVGGNTAANGTFVITKVNDNSFSLDGSTGNGAYTSGGDWNVTGAYRYSIAVTEGNGFAKNKKADVLFTYEVSSTSKTQQSLFMIN